MGKLLFFALPVMAATMAGLQAEGEQIIVEGVDQYRVCEPMFEAVRVVLSHRGENYSPAYIQGISGAAFRVAGPCPCAPTCSTAMGTEELLDLLGYEYKHLNLSGKDINPESEVHSIVPRVKEEIRAGRPVIVWHAFTNAEWDVVCGFDEEKKQFLGRGSYRGNDSSLAAEDETRMAKCLHICPAYGAIIIGEKTREFDVREAELAALEEAVHHAYSPRDRFLDEAEGVEKPWRFREGLACYDVWIDNFRTNPDRVPGSGDRYCLGWCKSTHSAAAEFMRELASRYLDVREHFLQATEYFDADSEALNKLHDEVFEGWSGYKEADPERAKRTIDLLTKSRENYAQGIEEIRKALEKIDPERAERARQTARVQRENGKVWIQDIQKLKWDAGRDCTFAGAVSEAMKVTEHPYVYHEVMGLTGLAFRTRWCNEDTKTKWCGSVAIGEIPDEQMALSELTGWKLPTHWLDTEGRDNDSLRKKIVASIDAGKPVIAYPQHWNMAVIYGYEDNGKILLISDYVSEEFPFRLPVEELGPLFTYLGDYEEPPSLRDGLLEALGIAVENWKRERHHGGLEDREYWYGAAAFDAWIGDLRKYEEFSEETRKSLIWIDPWNYKSLYDARKAAVIFLKEWGVVLEGDARQALEKAAGIYEEETKVLEDLLADKRSDEKKNLSKEARSREIEILTKARDLEAEAIAEIERALQTASTDAKVLGKLTYKSRLVTHLGCLEGACEYLGIDITPGWLYGGTGHAFVMCLGEDLCPSGPHCWDQGPLHRLSKNLPFRIGGVAGPKATPELLEKAWHHVQKSIDQGHPCYGWHWEWIMIKGYDEEGYLYSGCLEPPKDWRKFGAEAIGFLELYSVRPEKPTPDAKTIRDSLEFAVAWADSPQKWAMDGYSGGLDAYDTWIKGLSSGTAAYQELTYHAAIWSECRSFAAQFLEEANVRTQKKYDDLFQSAIGNYKVVATCLEKVKQLAPLPGWPLSDEDKEELKSRSIDDALRDEIITELKKAKEAETAGIETFREIVAALDTELRGVSAVD